MYQLKSLEDTIAAISTPIGQGGIGMVRLSGRNALFIADQIFITKQKGVPSQFKSFSVHYGWVVKKTKEGQEEIVDEALLTVMRAPHSYTREDVVEISSHGGIVCLRAILTLALDFGARLAEPGEFTKRAFLNGRIDLSQAEAVLDIIQAKTNAALRMSTNQLKGDLSIELEVIRERMMNIYVQIEAMVNFPEDGIHMQDKAKIECEIDQAGQKVDQLLASSDHGRILKEGIRIVICGKPNVGKSSLLNVLLGIPRAIVSDVPGTTRDTIEETAQIEGIPFQLVDTAGILEPRDLIEEEAVKRSHLCIRNCNLILFLFDGSQRMSQEDKILMDKLKGQKVLVVLNKCDLTRKLEDVHLRAYFPDENVVKISALKKIGIDELKRTIVENVWRGHLEDTQGLLISNVRHIKALQECRFNLDKAKEILKDGLSLEFISEEIKIAINHLDNITGRNIDNDLLEVIFSQFCIGK